MRSGIEFFRALINPYLMRKEADARVYVAKKELEIERIRASNYDTTMKKMPDFLTGSEIHENIDPTWFMNYYDIVGNICDDDIQNLFAAIMAGELESPGGCSVRTLRTVSQLSRSEAELFRDMCRCVISVDGKLYIPKSNDAEGHSPFRYESHLIMEDCGLVQTSGVNAYSRIMDDGGPTQIKYQGCALGSVVPVSGDGGRIVLKGISALTGSGRELYGILSRYGMVDTDEMFFIRFMRHLRDSYDDLEIHAYQITGTEEGKTFCAGPDILEHSDEEALELLHRKF